MQELKKYLWQSAFLGNQYERAGFLLPFNQGWQSAGYVDLANGN